MRLIKTLTFILCCALITLATNALAGDYSFCSQYAQSAILQYQRAKAAGCPDINYPVWSDSGKNHLQWCLKVTQSEAESGTRLRDNILLKCAGSNIESNEVIVYEFPNFLGASQRFRLEPGMRHREIRVLSLRPAGEGQSKGVHSAARSIRIGTGVSVFPYREADFSAELYDLCTKKLDADNPDLKAEEGDECRPVRSLIIVPRGKKPNGVRIGIRSSWRSGTFTSSNAYTNSFKGLPERAGMNTRCHRLNDKGHNYIKKGLAESGHRVILNPDPGVEGIVFSQKGCTGESITFPGPGSTKREFVLEDYGWEKGQSIMVRNTAPETAIVTGTSTVVTMPELGFPVPQTDESKRRAPPSPDTAPVAPPASEKDQILDMRWRQEGGDIIFEFDYSIDHSHTPPVFVGAWLYEASNAFGGYTPTAIQNFGKSTVRISVTLPPESRKSDSVEVFFFESGQQPFVKRRFPLRHIWTR